ncbi:unnamed protein product [Toxocara canis]|uniref:Uncharacterized protein n=1 Tax=Toxocara canis TaxID=6265 RepID=A0A183UI87_TOXCA|nr:unnamed protein product [Toxocara canis]
MIGRDGFQVSDRRPHSSCLMVHCLLACNADRGPEHAAVGAFDHRYMSALSMRLLVEYMRGARPLIASPALPSPPNCNAALYPFSKTSSTSDRSFDEVLANES